MFTGAVRVATAFTNPYVGLRRRRGGTVFTTMGAFIVVNSDGWILTSAHVIDEIVGREHETQAADGETCADGIVAHVELWALPGFSETKPRLVEAHVNRVADVAVCRLEPFDAMSITGFPVLRDTYAEPIDQGMSVCRLGFPFCDVPATFAEDRGEFVLEEHAFPVPRFVLDGVVARFNRRFAEDGDASAVFIETSTPGLRGQSGGPLLDVGGRLCGVQSHTEHIDLGFDAQYATDEGPVTERQFLNVGAASHVDEVRAMLDSAEVRYNLG